MKVILENVLTVSNLLSLFTSNSKSIFMLYYVLFLTFHAIVYNNHLCQSVEADYINR